jgi:hypothetical protein
VTCRWGPRAPPGRWLVADWGSGVERVRERGGQDLRQDCLGGFPSLVSIRIGQSEEEGEGNASRSEREVAG